MKKNNVLLLLSCIFLLFSSCSSFVKAYGLRNGGYIEGPTNILLGTSVRFLRNEPFIFPFSFLQPVLPLPCEKYNIWFIINNEEKNDVMLFMSIDEFRIVLPSGRVIDLLDGKIDIIFYYRSKDPEGRLNESVENVKPQSMGGVKRLFFDGIKYGDGLNFHFYARIPAYSVDSVRIEYTLNCEWENHGAVKRREIYIFNKKMYKSIFFTT
jgi:hypothetical protein